MNVSDTKTSSLRLWESLLFFGVPCAALLLSYAAICLDVGSIWPGNAPVHESGGRTLTETIFWLEHGVREIPIDLLLGLAIAASLLLFSQPASALDEQRRRLLMNWSAGLLATLTLCIVIGATLLSGPVVVLEEFAQMHTRPGTPPVWGSHWDSHLLSRAALMVAALTVGGLHGALAGRQDSPRQKVGRRAFIVAVAIFLLITVFLGPNPMPFIDAVLIGHQARELATHLVVTLPLSFGAGLFALRYQSRQEGVVPAAFSLRAVPAVSWIGLALVTLIGGFLTVGFFATAAYGQGQSSNLVSLVFVHFFEHGLSYVFTPLWVALLCAWLAKEKT